MLLLFNEVNKISSEKFLENELTLLSFNDLNINFKPKNNLNFFLKYMEILLHFF